MSSKTRLKRDMLGPLRSCEADIVDAGLIGTSSLTRENSERFAPMLTHLELYCLKISRL